MKKILEYNLPDYLYSTTTELGKKSTQLYDGVEELILWIEKETGKIEQTFAPNSEPDRPLPLNIKREILVADSIENTIKIALLYGGLEKPKIYEIKVGPDDQPNNIMTDPSDIRMVFDENYIVKDYKAPLQFRIFDRDRSDEFIRSERNAKLLASDARIAHDMPEELLKQWTTYRQKLRDHPKDWAGVPNYLVRFPMAPDETIDMNFDDLEVDVIRISNRTEEDKDAINNFPPGVY